MVFVVGYGDLHFRDNLPFVCFTPVFGVSVGECIEQVGIIIPPYTVDLYWDWGHMGGRHVIFD
jgi:hypothetical protein